MFNWYSAPTFAAMLLFWLQACYLLTRSPQSPVAATAVGTLVAAALYLLGQGMLANAQTLDDWRGWASGLQWGATIAPLLWYWVTVLLLREQAGAQRYLRWIAYPLGALFALGSVILTASIYSGDALYRWSTPVAIAPEQATYFRYRVPVGLLYPVFIALAIGTTVGAAANLCVASRLVHEPERRRRFAWLLLSAVLFIVGSGPTSVANWFFVASWPTWLGHAALAAGAVVLAVNITAYSLLVELRVLGNDFLSFITAQGAVSVLYLAVFFLAAPALSFQWLGLLAVTLLLVVLTHALADVGRGVLDRVFFASEVRQLRSNLASVAQRAVLTEDLGELLHEARRDLADLSAQRFVRLTEEALRRLNSPAGLARCGLIGQLPHTLAARHAAHEDQEARPPTPLQQAQALREVLVAAIERLKPPDPDPKVADAGGLQYHILREEYLLGMPNKQIMMRHAVSEGTFHRNRREAIAILTRELKQQEELLAQANRAPA